MVEQTHQHGARRRPKRAKTEPKREKRGSRGSLGGVPGTLQESGANLSDFLRRQEGSRDPKWEPKIEYKSIKFERDFRRRLEGVPGAPSGRFRVDFKVIRV